METFVLAFLISLLQRMLADPKNSINVVGVVIIHEYLVEKARICLLLVMNMPLFSAVPITFMYLIGNDFLLPFKENRELITVM